VRDTIVAVLAFTYSVWAIAGAGNDVVTKGFVLLLCGIPVYVAMRWWDRRTAPPAVEPRVPVTVGRFTVERPTTKVGGNGAR
jgi:APA family basic amino acid/polyamine antiporter